MSSSTPLAQSFCTDLINHGVFKEAEALVRDTYKLQVEAKQSEKKFVITAVGTELLELAVHLLKSWLERKKKRNGDSIDDRIKDTKENPLLDISVGYVIWMFWGELGSKLLSEDWKKEAEKIKFVESPSVTIYRNPEKKTLCVTCNFECFEAVKKKVENLIRQVTSGISGLPSLDKSQKSESSNGYKGKGQSGIDGSKGKYMDGTVRQLKGASREYKLPPPHLGGKENGSTRMPHSSASKDESSETDKQSLFCTKNFEIKVFVYEASIVSLSGIDAIVNAANEHLSHGGGVPYHISKAAGGDKSSLEIECHNYIKKNKKVYVTKNFTSSAGNMPYKGVIHAVGPMWTEYKAKDECAKDLCMTIINVLIEADKKKFSKIAVPAISSGIYGVPKKLCAEMYIRGVIDYDRVNLQTCVREIHFVDIAKDILQEISNAYERWKQNDNNINFKNANIYSSVSEKELPVHKSDGDQRNVVNLSGICSYDKCKRKGEKRCKNCCKVVCTLCIMDVDSSETQCPFCKKNFNLENKKTREKQQEHPDIPSNEVDNCPICMETLTSPKMLPCGHEFHAECIDQSLKYKKNCPICGIVVGALTGYQPPGLMHYNILKDITPPGFEKCGTIEIFYDFPDGFQEEDHPHPGMPYKGTRRRAFLPNNTEGIKMLKLLQVAFDRKLIFTIGESRTTGKKNIVTWNGIHHKTKMDGGPTNFGYPDETYLKRVQEELADKGVTEKDITDNGVTEKDITDKGVTEKDIRGTPSRYSLVQEASGSDHELSSDFVEGSERKANDGTPSRYRLVQKASGSDHELSSDFVEGSEWKANDGRNCVLLLLVKYTMVQGKKTIKAVKSIPCTWNFLAYWNFYTKTKQGKKLLDDIVKKYGCSVTLCTADEDLFIFEVTGTNFRQESDMLDFVNDVLNNIYEGAKQSLCCEFCSVSHRMQEDTLKRVKEKKELHSTWIQLVGEHDPDAVYVVCTLKDKVSVLIVLTEVISEVIQSNMKKQLL